MMPEKKRHGPTTEETARRKRSLGTFVPNGEYVPDELDRAILRALPDEGAKQGKYLPRGLSAAQVRKLVDIEAGSSGTYARRLSLLLSEGYVVIVRVRVSDKAWQRTAKGKLAALPDE